MFSLFCNIRTGRKGQLASLMTVFLIVFIIFAFLSVNLGRMALHRTRSSNAADAAVLAAGSSASRLLNYMAAFNDLMALNFSGLTFMLVPAFTALIVDIVRLFENSYDPCHMSGGPDAVDDIIASFSAITDDETNYATFADGLLVVTEHVVIIGMDVATIAFLVQGARKIGDVLSARIVSTDPDDPGMNMLLPESTRDTARQYAFINAGIDEPREDYDDWVLGTNAEDVDGDGDEDWDDYIRQESDFSAFMRTLSNTNDADSDFSADNLVSFDWDDQRAGEIVNTQVDVYTTPTQSLDLTVETYEDVATESGLRSLIGDAITQSDSSWSMSQLFNLGLQMSPLSYLLLELIIVLIEIITALLLILAAVAVIIGVVYTIKYAISYGSDVASLQTALKAYTYAGAAGGWYAGMAALDTNEMDPGDLPALVLGDEDNDLTNQVEIHRTTTPEDGPDSIDYGFWTMQYPQIRSGSEVLVSGSGGGLLFPPITDYGAVIQQAW